MAEAVDTSSPKSREYYQREWGIALPFDPAADYTRHQEIRQLFEEASWKRRKSGQPAGDFQFFLVVYVTGGRGLSEAREHFARFLRDVSTCSECVLTEVRNYINPPRQAT